MNFIKLGFLALVLASGTVHAGGSRDAFDLIRSHLQLGEGSFFDLECKPTWQSTSRVSLGIDPKTQLMSVTRSNMAFKKFKRVSLPFLVSDGNYDLTATLKVIDTRIIENTPRYLRLETRLLIGNHLAKQSLLIDGRKRALFFINHVLSPHPVGTCWLP